MNRISLGSFRFGLAILVASSHLWNRMLPGYAAFAVWGFFVLSGYLMTNILVRKYGFSPAGIAAYAKNRALRILPAYYLALLAGVVVLSFYVHPSGTSFAVPKTFRDWIFPVTLIEGFSQASMPVPVANALGIEVCAYFLMPLLARWKWVAWGVLAYSAVANYSYGFTIDSFNVRYATFVPCLMPFAFGALIFHYEKLLSRFKVSAVTCLIVWMIYGGSWLISKDWPWSFGLYVSMFFSGWVVISLSDVKSIGYDSLAGELSYPVYLFHSVVGLTLTRSLGYQSTRFFLVAIVCTLIVSWLVNEVLDRQLKKFKSAPTVRLTVAQRRDLVPGCLERS